MMSHPKIYLWSKFGPNRLKNDKVMTFLVRVSTAQKKSKFRSFPEDFAKIQKQLRSFFRSFSEVFSKFQKFFRSIKYCCYVNDHSFFFTRKPKITENMYWICALPKKMRNLSNISIFPQKITGYWHFLRSFSLWMSKFRSFSGDMHKIQKFSEELAKIQKNSGDLAKIQNFQKL